MTEPEYKFSKIKYLPITRRFEKGYGKTYCLIKISSSNWRKCMQLKQYGVPIRTPAPRRKPGDILLVRRDQDSHGDYGVMGFWYIIGEEKAVPPYHWPGEYTHNIHIAPIIEFSTPFNEEMSRKDNLGRCVSPFSIKVDGLKGMPHLSGSMFRLTASTQYKKILRNYIEGILKEKTIECNFHNFEYHPSVDETLINEFIKCLEEYVDQQLEKIRLKIKIRGD